MANVSRKSGFSPAERFETASPPWQIDPIKGDMIRRAIKTEERAARAMSRIIRSLNNAYSAKSINRMLDEVMALFGGVPSKMEKKKAAGVGSFRKLKTVASSDIRGIHSATRTRSPYVGKLQAVPSPATIHQAGLPTALNPDRPKNSAGAVSFHFEYRTVTRGDGAEDGKAASHQRYITRGTEDVYAKLSEAGNVEDLRTLRENYLARDGAIEIIRGSYTGGTFAPQESRVGFSMLGNIGINPSDRAYFWNAVEQIEPRNVKGVVRMRIGLSLMEMAKYLQSIGIPDESYVQNNGWYTIRVADRAAADRLIYKIKAHARMQRTPTMVSAEFCPNKSGRIQNRIIAELAHELSPEQRFEVIKRFTTEQFEKRNLPYFAVIHVPSDHGDDRNYHAHIDFYDRPCTVDANGYWDFLDPATRQKKDREASKMGWVMQLRQAYAEVQNQVLSEANLPKRYFAESYAFVGIEQDAGQHLGPKVYALEAQGVQTQRGLIASWKEVFRDMTSKKARDAERRIWNTVTQLGHTRDEVLLNIEEREKHPGRPQDQTRATLELVTDYVETALADEAYREERRQEQSKTARILGTFDFRERNLQARLEKFQNAPEPKPRKNETQIDVEATRDFRLYTIRRQLKEIPLLRAEVKLAHELRWIQLELRKPQMDQIAAHRAKLEFFLAPSTDVMRDSRADKGKALFTSTYDRVTKSTDYDETLTRDIAGAQHGNVSDDSAMQVEYEKSSEINAIAARTARMAKTRAAHEARLKPMVDEARAWHLAEIERIYGPAEEAARLQAQEDAINELRRAEDERRARNAYHFAQGYDITDLEGNLIKDQNILRTRAGGRRAFDYSERTAKELREIEQGLDPNVFLDDIRNDPFGYSEAQKAPPRPPNRKPMTAVQRRMFEDEIAQAKIEAAPFLEAERLRKEAAQAAKQKAATAAAQETAAEEQRQRQARILAERRQAASATPATPTPAAAVDSRAPVEISLARPTSIEAPQRKAPDLFDPHVSDEFRQNYPAYSRNYTLIGVAGPAEFDASDPTRFAVNAEGKRVRVGSAPDEAPNPALWTQIDRTDIAEREAVALAHWMAREHIMIRDGIMPAMPVMTTVIEGSDLVRPKDLKYHVAKDAAENAAIPEAKFVASMQARGFAVSQATVPTSPAVVSKDFRTLSEQRAPTTFAPAPGIPAPRTAPATPTPTPTPASPASTPTQAAPKPQSIAAKLAAFFDEPEKQS